MTSPGANAPDLFYPIVPDAGWVARLAPLGVRTLQLRVKNGEPRKIETEIREALELAARHGIQLIINDYWREAIKLGATYVHLGQDDLAMADRVAIKNANIRLGISTHCEEELATALTSEPDYIALGPIYETKLKTMPWAPQGIERVRAWKERIGTLPLVAIGGLTPERAQAVFDAGADSLAVITDFLTAPHPEARVRLWLDWAKALRP